jgi:hypothetical protein
VLAGAEGVKEEPCGVAAESGAQQLVDLDDNRVTDQEIAPEFGDEGGGEIVCVISPVGGREQWPGVSDDVQRAWTGSRR